jgi:hypothetical protein
MLLFFSSPLGILNGRFLGDSLGNCSYFDARGGCSVIDYTIVSEEIFHYISYFNVLKYRLYIFHENYCPTQNYLAKIPY